MMSRKKIKVETPEDNPYGYSCTEGNEEKMRNEAYRRMREVCEEELRICPSCGTSSALYFAASTAIDSIQMGQDAFVDLAKRIWADAYRQAPKDVGIKH